MSSGIIEESFEVNFILTRTNAQTPTTGTPNSAGYDVYSADEDCVILPGESRAFNLGVVIDMPDECYVEVHSRSGSFVRNGIVAFLGIIDPDYHRELIILLVNTHPSNPCEIKTKDRIAQIIFKKRLKLNITTKIDLSYAPPTEGHVGFGSTGK